MNAIPQEQINEHFAAANDDAVDAELCLLASVLLDNRRIKAAWPIAKPEHFAEPEVGRMYEIAHSMIMEGREANPVTLCAFYTGDTRIRDMTVSQFLARITANVPGMDAETYAHNVLDSYVSLRAMQELADGIQSLSKADIEAKPRDKIAYIRARLNAVADLVDAYDGMEVELGEVVDGVLEETDAVRRGERKSGSDPCFEPVRRLTGPWSGGQLIICGAGTKQGKTALAFQCATAMAMAMPVFAFSREMKAPEIARRELARICKTESTRMKSGTVSEKEIEMMADAARRLRNSKMVLQDRDMTLSQIDDRVGRMVDRHNSPCLVVVDYIALVARDRESYKMSKVEFCDYVTNNLKKIAGKHDVPILALAQMKKNSYEQVYQRDMRKRLEAVVTRLPRYTDLYGGIEYDADHVLMPFRPLPLIEQLEPIKGSEDHEVWQEFHDRYATEARLVLALSREAYFPKTIDVGWDGKTTSFIDLRQEDYGRTMF